MNRNEAIETIRANATRALLAEMEYRLDEDREPEDWPQGYDLFEAFTDVSEDEGKQFRVAVLDVEIALGVWVETTPENIAEQIAVGFGVKGSHFPKRKGKRYELAKRLDEIITKREKERG